MPRRRLSHVDAEGAARMVDVSDKAVTSRTATARGRIWISRSAMRLVRAGRLKKGGVVEVARLAGIMAAKRTSDAIPLCHPLPLGSIDVELTPRLDGFVVEARVRTEARTGAEMEALHAVAVAALAVYDMVKAADRGMRIGDIRLVEKTGGASGDYRAPGSGTAARPPRSRHRGAARPPRSRHRGAARPPRSRLRGAR